VKSYSLFNRGEPLLVSDFRARVEYVNAVKRADCHVDISTNGMLLTDDMIAFLCGQTVTVTVSFDSADKARFESIRRGADFTRICRNLQRLCAAYKEAALPDSPGIYTSIQKENQGELPEIAWLAHGLGVRRMGFGLITAPTAFAPAMDAHLCHAIEETSAYIHVHGMLNDIYPTRVGDMLFWGDGMCP